MLFCDKMWLDIYWNWWTGVIHNYSQWQTKFSKTWLMQIPRSHCTSIPQNILTNLTKNAKPWFHSFSFSKYQNYVAIRWYPPAALVFNYCNSLKSNKSQLSKSSSILSHQCFIVQTCPYHQGSMHRHYKWHAVLPRFTSVLAACTA